MKIKILSILILFLFFNKMEAQQGVRVSPIVGLEYHKLYSDLQTDKFLFHPDLFLIGSWNYRVGLNFNFPLNNSLTIISGVHYFKLGTVFEYDESLIPGGFWPTTSNPPSPIYDKYIKSVTGIPLYLRINEHLEKHFLFVETGMSVNFTEYTIHKRLLATEVEVITDTIEDREIFVFLKLALGFGYKVSNKVNLAVSPLVRYRPRMYDDNIGYTHKQHEFTYGMMIKTEIKI